MEINLKKLAQQKEQLKYIQTVLANQQITKALSKKLNELIRFIDEIETDLEMCGESIVELDKPRLEAIEERNKMLNFLHDGDDI
jgi:heme oxygenase